MVEGSGSGDRSETHQSGLRKVEYIDILQSYYLDLSTLLQILSRQKRSGTLSVEQLHVPAFRGNVSVSIEIEYGVVRSCQIMQRQTVVAHGQVAIQVLASLQSVEWRWSSVTSPQSTPSHEPSPSPGRSSAPQTLFEERPTQPLPRNQEPLSIPRQTFLAQDPKILSQLSRQHRRVLALIDGNRTHEQIASILAISAADLPRYTSDLEQWGLISSRPSRDSR
jgi:hypothetical protein